MAVRGGVVEIVENTDRGSAGLPAIKPNAVRINGVDVGLVEYDSVKVEFGGREVVRVTLTLLPTEVIFKGRNRMYVFTGTRVCVPRFIIGSPMLFRLLKDRGLITLD